MTTTLLTPVWESKRTSETRSIEQVLQSHFRQVDVYRYNSASIRVRVIDPAFEGKSREERDAMVERILEMLPEESQRDIVLLLTLSPSQVAAPIGGDTLRDHMLNSEFENPRPSTL